MTNDYNAQSTEVSTSHRTYVENLLKYYRENDIRPGDPNEGIWHLAHYPCPKRLGGTQVIHLLREHHAAQGVLQSEEYGVTCFAMWERKYLPEHLLSLHDEWKSRQSSVNFLAYFEGLTEEEFRFHIRRMRSGITPESEERRIRNSSETLIKLKAIPRTLEHVSGEIRHFRSLRNAAITLEIPAGHLRRTLTPLKNGEPRYAQGWRLL